MFRRYSPAKNDSGIKRSHSKEFLINRKIFVYRFLSKHFFLVRCNNYTSCLEFNFSITSMFRPMEVRVISSIILLLNKFIIKFKCTNIHHKEKDQMGNLS